MSSGGLALEWIGQAAARIVVGAPENRLPGFPGLSVFDAPLVACADGDDPVFDELRRAAGPRHLHPRAVLDGRLRSGGSGTRVSVIAWALPFSAEVRASNRGAGWPSRLYSLARNRGQAVNDRLGRALANMLRTGGWAAVAPVLTKDYDIFHAPDLVYTSTWSERHVAFAAGLGRFGLNGSLITARGSHVRLGSIVTNLALAATPRAGSPFAPCLSQGAEVCGHCLERCPVEAVGRGGLDKKKCNARRKEIGARNAASLQGTPRLKRFQLPIDGVRRWTYPLGCALCQCGVPCEAEDPFS
jgi:epoxyqueuosine reductase